MEFVFFTILPWFRMFHSDFKNIFRVSLESSIVHDHFDSPLIPGITRPDQLFLDAWWEGEAKVGVRDYEVTRLRRGLPETGWRFPRRRSPLQRPITRKTSILTQSTHGEYFIRDSGIFPSNFAAIPLHPATVPRKIRVKTSENVNWSEPPPSARGKQVRGRRDVWKTVWHGVCIRRRGKGEREGNEQKGNINLVHPCIGAVGRKIRKLVCPALWSTLWSLAARACNHRPPPPLFFFCLDKHTNRKLVTFSRKQIRTARGWKRFVSGKIYSFRKGPKVSSKDYD